MAENTQAEDIMESGGEQIKIVTEKKWKLPRVQSPMSCYSMYEWAFRLSLSDMILGGGFAYLFFWLSTTIDLSKEGTTEAGRAALIVFGVIFCIVIFFGLVLFIGLWNVHKLKVLLRVYCWYAISISIIIFLLLFSSAIFIMVNGDGIGIGFGAIFIAVLLAGYEFYIACLINSIYMNILEGKEELNLKKGLC